jgi:hypothetical protein
MVKENSFGLIKALIMETSSKTIFMDKESISGQMVVFTTVSGLITKWKDKAPSLGVMAVDTRETIKMIRNMVMELLSGLTAESILETGARVNNMEKEFTSKRVKRDKVSGKWEKELSGSRITRPTNEPQQIFSPSFRFKTLNIHFMIMSINTKINRINFHTFKIKCLLIHPIFKKSL